MAVDAQSQKLILAQAVARRICHDLAGPIGTLAAALDCVGDDQEALPLATETAAALTARLRLLRGAWGGGVEALDAAALAALAPGLPGAERLRLNAACLTGPLDGAAARLCLCLLLIAAAALPKGGAIAVGGAGETIWLDLDGPGAAWPAALNHDTTAAWLEDPAPRILPAALARLLAESCAWTLSVSGTRVVAAMV